MESQWAQIGWWLEFVDRVSEKCLQELTIIIDVLMTLSKQVHATPTSSIATEP